MISFSFTGGKQLKKIVATMYIKNITRDDDSQFGKLGRYECHAFTVNDTTLTSRKHGFSVNVIMGKYSLSGLMSYRYKSPATHLGYG